MEVKVFYCKDCGGKYMGEKCTSCNPKLKKEEKSKPK